MSAVDIHYSSSLTPEEKAALQVRQNIVESGVILTMCTRPAEWEAASDAQGRHFLRLRRHFSPRETLATFTLDEFQRMTDDEELKRQIMFGTHKAHDSERT